MNFFKKIINKITGASSKEKGIKTPEKETQTEEQKRQPDEPQTQKKTLTDEEIMMELNMIAPGILSQLKSPEQRDLVIRIYRKMIEDGVDVKNEKEVEKWMKANQDKFASDLPKVETYRREKPKVGRNDPCPCGSGKKYKKCCGAKE